MPGYHLEPVVYWVYPSPGTERTLLLRCVNPHTNAHFYTTSQSEYDEAVSGGYESEGNACWVPSVSSSETTPFFRAYNDRNFDHFYTTSELELANAVNIGYTNEGVACLVLKAEQLNVTAPLYRLLNDVNHDHFYTISISERDLATAAPRAQEPQLQIYYFCVTNDTGSQLEYPVSAYTQDEAYNQLAAMKGDVDFISYGHCSFYSPDSLKYTRKGIVQYQQNWRWCNKCEVLCFADGKTLGTCAAGGIHDHTGSGGYFLGINSPALPGQQNWRWCNKCEVLCFAGGKTLGNCAAGGMHDHTGSGNYVLGMNVPALPGQQNWRWCNKCEVLCFAGGKTLGNCAAGGMHDHTGSGNYTIPKM
jgi:Repeat of unknown function (DUF5648)